MEDERRGARRLTQNGVGWLSATGFRAPCAVEDLSVSGARVRIPRTRLSKRSSLPSRLSLTVVVGGEQVSVPGRAIRADHDEAGMSLSLRFDNPQAANLGWLIDRDERDGLRAPGSGRSPAGPPTPSAA